MRFSVEGLTSSKIKALKSGLTGDSKKNPLLGSVRLLVSSDSLWLKSQGCYLFAQCQLQLVSKVPLIVSDFSCCYELEKILFSNSSLWLNVSHLLLYNLIESLEWLLIKFTNSTPHSKRECIIQKPVSVMATFKILPMELWKFLYLSTLPSFLPFYQMFFSELLR